MQFKERQHIVFGKQLLTGCLLTLLFLSLGWESYARQDKLYKEYVNIHLPRTSFVSGELIAMKAYCFSNQDDPADFLSRALYLELIDKSGNSLITQALEVEANQATSIISIPDTLQTGSYTLKAYTNWMKNFGDDYFFSQPILVYNSFDDESEAKLEAFTHILEPRVFVESGEMIADIPVRLKVLNPDHTSPAIAGKLSEAYTGRLIEQFATGSTGEAYLNFIPKDGKQYMLTFGDSTQAFKSFYLPMPRPSGYAFVIDSLSKKETKLDFYASHVPQEELVFTVYHLNRKVTEVPVSGLKNHLSVKLRLPFTRQGIYKLVLSDRSGVSLSEQQIIVSEKMSSAEKMECQPRTEQQVEIDMQDFLLPEGASYSASIHKLTEGEGPRYFNGGSYWKLAEGMQLILPREFRLTGQEGSKHRSPDAKYPVEDLGMLYSGFVINPVNRSPLSEIDVVLAMKDTVSIILAARTNKEGKFSILVNEEKNKDAFISLYLNSAPVSGNFRLLLEEKYYYKALRRGRLQSYENPVDHDLMAEMDDETDRILIQRAFGNMWNYTDTSAPSQSYLERRFYGEPTLTVYPDVFFFLPNFEEIAREIVPRLRYKHNAKECKLILSDIESSTRSENPIILIDGNLIMDPCDLYEFDSDDIQRLEVQTGYRTCGNLFYNGLLAIYTTDAYKKKNGKLRGKQIYPVPGYLNNESKLMQRGEVADDAPDFKNMLYWNPNLTTDEEGKLKIGFSTSDEEGDYIIEVVGYTSEGMPVHTFQLIQVKAN